ncbi:MAG: TrkA family potassium uptake protein [Erysipelotrichaceae bacterium]|jgi:trk system potassium uptake protein TrkA|nr:TrkA family potassium uptake protein [Erysipelotrichaceae bacterium]
MAKKKSFAVIGLGQFGVAVVEELVANGADVIAIDNDEDNVHHIAGILPTAFVADSTDEEALRELGIKDVDVAIVAFGHNDQATVITTVILKEIGVKDIVVRVDNGYYIPIIKKLGANEVVTPQKAAGEALANRLGEYDYKDFYKLDKDYSVVSIAVNQTFVPVSIMELNPKEKFDVNVVLIVRENEGSFVPGGKDQILPNDKIFVVGTTKDIRDFRKNING